MAARVRFVTLMSSSLTKSVPHFHSRNIHTVRLNRLLSNTKHRQLLSKHLCQQESALRILLARNASTEASGIPSGYVPDIPVIPDTVATITLPELNALGEPTLQSMGLGSNTPAGLMQQLLEYLHVSLDIPWFGSIAIMAVGVRLLIFPLLGKQRKHLMQLKNHTPTIQRIQDKISQAQAIGDVNEIQRRSAQLQDYMKRNDISYKKTFMAPIAQFPIFISMFLGLRGMAELPVDSMKTGGFAWFVDLTMKDPYLALPVITGITLLAIMELGAESNKISEMSHHWKWGMRCFPIITTVFMMRFPAALAFYWTVTNFLSLLVTQIFKIPRVKVFFKIPQEIKQPKSKQEKKKFVEGFKDMYESSKVSSAIANRRRVEETEFRKAGTGPVPKTYAYDPTKVRKRQAASS